AQVERIDGVEPAQSCARGGPAQRVDDLAVNALLIGELNVSPAAGGGNDELDVVVLVRTKQQPALFGRRVDVRQRPFEPERHFEWSGRRVELRREGVDQRVVVVCVAAGRRVAATGE